MAHILVKEQLAFHRWCQLRDVIIARKTLESQSFYSYTLAMT